MRYFVKKTSPVTWEVENEEDQPHYVRYDIFKQIWICDCAFNGMIEKECKHIIFSKQNLVYGIEIFDEYKP